jgi:hypothetical protein
MQWMVIQWCGPAALGGKTTMTTYAENDTVNLITRMPAGLRRQLKHYATERDTSMSKLVTQAVEELMAKRPAAECGSIETAAAAR